jgi:hypothetical protein
MTEATGGILQYNCQWSQKDVKTSYNLLIIIIIIIIIIRNLGFSSIKSGVSGSN